VRLFYEPTVLADAIMSMKVTREETFGPVAPFFRFRDDPEAIRLASDTEFGLDRKFLQDLVHEALCPQRRGGVF
jgi:succinate-semialdehyde dehydrogenase/glutarate-semialdehyde dehydrogenase